MKTKTILLLIAILFSPVFSYGQKANKKITITGKVVDANLKPVSGAAIFVDKVKTDITTDEQGNYKVKVRPDAKEILVFTLVYGASKETINGRTKIDFVLGTKSEDTLESNKGSDMVTVKEEELSQKRTKKEFNVEDAGYSTYQTIYDMIRGRFPGVEVSGKSIKIMGSSSLNVSTEPIFVVDEYTRRLVKNKRLAEDLSYDRLQKLFEGNIAKSWQLYQDFHALIVIDGKNKK